MAIAFVGASATGNVTSGTVGNITYAPTSGHIVTIFVTNSGTTSALTVKDSSGVALTAGPTVTVAGGALIPLSSFYYTAGAGVTGYTATWVTSRSWDMACGEYSGANGGVNAGLAGNTATASTTTLTISPTTQENNDWIVAGFAAGVVTGYTQTNGNLRADTTITTAKVILADNTAASAGVVTVSGTVSAAEAWGAIALELRLSVVIAAANYNQLMMVGAGT